MPLTGERAKEYQRLYKRKQRAAVKMAAAALVQSVAQQKPGRPLTLAKDIQPVGQQMLQDVLKRSNLDMDSIAGKVQEKLNAERPYNGNGNTIMVADNDAQLRAAELAIRLHERAGSIPAGPEAHAQPGLTLIELHYHAQPQQVVSSIADNSDASQVIDITEAEK